MRLKSAPFKKLLNKLGENEYFGRLQTIFNRLLILIIIGVVLYQLHNIGWRDVLATLPSQPLFYIIFIFLFFSLPIAEIFIYRQIWQFRMKEGFKAFLIKRVYNDEVMGYSGEFYLLMWARKQLALSGKTAIRHIRDISIISSLNSYFIAALLVGALVLTGQIDLSRLFSDLSLIYILLPVILLLIGSVVVYRFRTYIFGLPAAKALTISGIYFTRFVTHHLLLVVQWMVVLPHTPVSVWFVFLAMYIVVNRLPFLPSKELVFVSAGIELSQMLDMATASVAAMLLVSSVLMKLFNVIIFIYLSIKKKLPDAKKEDEDWLKEKQDQKNIIQTY